MSKPPSISNEAARLEALRAFGILDSMAEDVFDNVTKLASQICGTPIALITLVDADRQWFKSKLGLETPETPRAHAFCAHAIAGDDKIFEIRDATQDKRFVDNPLVTGHPQISFYAGAPLETSSGHKLGTVCVIDRKPRELSEGQRDALRALADQVIKLIEARAAQAELILAREAERAAFQQAETDRQDLQSVFDTSHVGMALVREPEFIFEKVNAAFSALVGPRDYLGRKWQEVYSDALDRDVLAKMEGVYRTGERFMEQERAVRVPGPEGSYKLRYLDVTYDRVQGFQKGSHGLLIQTVDITEEVRQRQVLAERERTERESKMYLETTLRSIGDAVISTTADELPKVRFLNVVAERLTGYSSAEAVGMPVDEVFRIINVKTRKKAFDPIYKVIHEGQTAGLANHTALISRSGIEYVIEDSAAPIIDTSGKVTGVVLVFRDVTEKYAAEEQVKLLGAVVRESRDFIGLTDTTGQSIYINPAGRALMGLGTSAQGANQTLDKIFSDVPGVESFAPVLASRGHWSGRVHLRQMQTGELIPCRLDTFQIGDAETETGREIAYLARDLRLEDEQDRQIQVAHAQVAESRQRLVETLRAMPVGVAFLEGPDFRYSFTNHIHASYFGGREDFVGRTVNEAIPELAGHGIFDVLARVYRTGEPFYAEEYPFTLKQVDGTDRRLSMNVAYQPLRDTHGEITGLVATLVDVTAMVRAREQLAEKNTLISETQRLLAAATKVARVGFFEWKIKSNYITFSEQMKNDWGVPAGVPIEQILVRIHPGDRDAVVSNIRRAIATGKIYFAEYRVRPPGREGYIWIEAQGEVTYDELGEPLTFFGTSVDITSRKTVTSEAEAVANSIPQMTWMTEPDGAINWFNQRWFEYTGTTLEEVNGWGWELLYHPEHRARVVARYHEHMTSGEPWEDTFPIRGKSGEFRWFLSRAIPIKDDSGKVVRWFGSNTDVTDQLESERELTKFAAVIESSTDFIGIADAHFRPIFINSAGRALIGFGTREPATSEIPDYFAPADRRTLRAEIMPALFRNGRWEGEMHLRHFETEGVIPVWYTMFAVRDAGGDVIAFATVSRDISERKRIEANLKEAKESAERANGAKSAFLANMSHEIRSPLGAIMGFSELIKNTELNRGDLTNYVSVIERNSHHLMRIVDDILDLSKVEAGKMVIESIEFSLPDLLADFTSLMSFRARDKGITFELRLTTPIPESVVSDPTRLRQILNNVVGNAIKFTERGSVRLSVSYLTEVLEFSVKDTGPGISPEQSERLFRAFEQADLSTTRKFGGTGLGLVLTRRLAEAMGGQFILRESRLGQGSTFEASITVARGRNLKMVEAAVLSCTVPAAPAPDSATPLRGLSVLVVEDSPDNQMLFELVLTKLGAKIQIASDGFEGVNAALNGKFDVVLCDVQMPRMDGYETTQALRDRGFTLPIVALTAHAMKDERARALASGFTDFLSKPIQREALIETILRVTRS